MTNPNNYAVGWICAVSVEYFAARVFLDVRIGGGAPNSKHRIRLDDIVVSAPHDGRGGAFEYDFSQKKEGKKKRSALPRNRIFKSTTNERSCGRW